MSSVLNVSRISLSGKKRDMAATAEWQHASMSSLMSYDE